MTYAPFVWVIMVFAIAYAAYKAHLLKKKQAVMKVTPLMVIIFCLIFASGIYLEMYLENYVYHTEDINILGSVTLPMIGIGIAVFNLLEYRQAELEEPEEE